MALSFKGIVNTVIDWFKDVSSSTNSAGATGKYNNTDYSGATTKAYDAGLTNTKNSGAITRSGGGNTINAIKEASGGGSGIDTKTNKSPTSSAAKPVGLAADSGTPTKSIFKDEKVKDKTTEILNSIATLNGTADLTPIISKLRDNRPKELSDASKTYISDINDPYEINSIADAVLTALAPMDLKYNRSAASHELAQQIAYRERAEATTGEKVQAIILRAALIGTQILGDVVVDKAFKPVVARAIEGDLRSGVQESVVNTLINLGETLDITALTLKPLFTGSLEADIGGKGYTKGELGGKYKRVYTTPKDYYLVPVSEDVDPLIKAIGERYKNAWGFGGSGRHNYDFEFDTGSKIADGLLNITGELLADPMNLVEALGKRAITGAVKTTLDDVASNIDAVVKGAAKDASEEAVEELTKIVSDSFEQARKVYNRDLFDKNIKFSDVFNDAITLNAFKHADLFDSSIGNDIILAAKTIAAAAQDSLAKAVSVPLTTLLRGWDDVQTAALKGIFKATPGGLATTRIVKAANKTIKAIDANKLNAVMKSVTAPDVPIDDAIKALRSFKTQTVFSDRMAKRSSYNPGVFPAAYNKIVEAKATKPMGIIRAKLNDMIKKGTPIEDCVAVLNTWIAQSNLLPKEVTDLSSMFNYFRRSSDANVLEQSVRLELYFAELLEAVPEVEGITETVATLKELLPATGYTPLANKEIPYEFTNGGVTYAFQRSFADEFTGTYDALKELQNFEVPAELLKAMPTQPVGIEFVYEVKKNLAIHNAIKETLAASTLPTALQESVLDTVYKMHSTPVTQLLREGTDPYELFKQRFFKELNLNLSNRLDIRAAVSEAEQEQIEQLIRSIVNMRAENWSGVRFAQNYSLLPRYGLSDAATIRGTAKALEAVDADAAALLHNVADALIKNSYNTKDLTRYLSSNIGWVATQGVSGLDSIATFCFKNTPGLSVHRAIVDDTLIRFYGTDVSKTAHSVADMSYWHAFINQVVQESKAIKNPEFLTKLNEQGLLDEIYDELLYAMQRSSSTLRDADFSHITAIKLTNLNDAEKYALLHSTFLSLFDNFADVVPWLRNYGYTSEQDMIKLFNRIRKKNPDFAATAELLYAVTKGASFRYEYGDVVEALHSISTGFAFNTPQIVPRQKTTAVIQEYAKFVDTVQDSANKVHVLQSILSDTKHNLAAQLGYAREYEMMTELLRIQEDAMRVLNFDSTGEGAIRLQELSEASQIALSQHVMRLDDASLFEYALNNGRGLVVLSPSSSAVSWRQAIRNGTSVAEDVSAAEGYAAQIQELINFSKRNVDGLIIHHVPEHIDDLGRYVPDRVYIGLDAAIDNSAFKFKAPTDSATQYGFDFTRSFSNSPGVRAANEYAFNLQELLAKYSNGASRMSNGAVMTIDKAMEIHSKLPAEFVSRIKTIDDLADMGAYKGTLYDGTLLCDNAYAKELCDNMNRLSVDDMVQSIHYSAQIQDAITAYTGAFFSDTSMHRAQNLFYGIPAEQAIDAVRNNPDAVPVRLVQNPRSSTGMELVKADPEDIFDEGVRIVSRNQRIQMSKIINKFEVNSAFVKFFNKCIMSPLKASYLQTFGMVARNVIGALQQNAATSHGFLDAAGLKDSYCKAWSAYGKYHDRFVYALEASRELGSKGITQEGFTKMVNDLGLTDLDIQEYRLVNDFMNSAASGGLLEEAMQVFKGTAVNQDTIDKMGNVLNTMVWGTPMGLITKNMNEHVEQINRLAKFFYELSSGANIEEALGGVIKAQYNYDKISEAAMYLDMVIPFSGFMLSNAKLWADLASESPWAIRLSLELFDAVSIYDDRDTSPMDLSNNPSLMYNALVGNAVLDNGMTVKLSNVMVEAFKLSMMPFTSITGSLAAPLAVPIDWAKATLEGTPWTAAEWQAQLAQLIPVYGTLAMRYDPTTQYTMENDEGQIVNVPRGSVLKAAQRLGVEFNFAEENNTIQRLLGMADPEVWTNWDASQTLVMLFPSLFGSTSRKYYFTYDGLKMYSTKDERTYLDHLASGAQAVYSQQDYDNAFKAYKNIVRYAYQFEGGEVVITDDYNRYLDAVSRGAATVPYTQDELFAKVIAQRVENMRPDEGPAKYAYQYSEGGKIYYTADKDTYDEAIAGGALPVNMSVQEIAALKAAWEQTCKDNPVYVFYYEGLRYTTGSEELYNKYIAEGAVAGAEDEYKKYIYGFTYGDKVLATTDPAKFKQHLEKGAEAVALTDAEIDSIYAQWNQFYSADSTPTQQTSYNKKSYKRTYNRTYTRSYKGSNSRAYNTYTRTNYNQYNNPSYWRTANASRAKPYRSVTHFYDVYNQVYTRRHSDKFKSRMLSFGKTSTGLPLLKSKLRYYIRL